MLSFRFLDLFSRFPQLFYNSIQAIFVDCTNAFGREFQGNPFIFLCQKKTFLLQIGQKTTLRLDILMGNTVSGDRPLAR